MFLCCVFALSATNAFADCQVLACGNTDKWNAEQQVGEVGNQCWFCGPGPRSCGQKDIVPFKNISGEITHLYRCVNDLTFKDFNFWGYGDKKGRWETYDPDVVCTDSPIRKIDVDNSYKVIHVESSKERRFESYVYYNDGAVGCWYITCKSGYRASEDKQSCILIKQEECDTGGGKWENNKCNCVDGYGWSDAQKQCVKTAQTLEKEKQQAAEKTAQASCEKSGGKWQNKKCQCDINRFLVESIPGKTCTCMSGYAYATGTSVCQMTDNEKLKQICNSIPGAKWLDTGNKCDCGTSKPMLIFNGTECVQDPEYLACVKAQPATKWNESGKKCVCTTANYVWNSDLEECEENEKLINQKNSNRIKQDIAGLKTNILASMDGWKKTLSVWKTSKGDFNTARLASDSVAGVVLGTAGGLITSKVVKKNQVKTGFEDISCTIGGQNVADWSDEFTVGIQ